MKWYLDQLSEIRSSSKDADIDYLKHAGIVATGLVLLETVVISCVLIILDGEGVLSIFLVDLSDALLGLGDVADPVGVDVELDGGFEEFDAFCGVDLFFHVGGFLIEICRLSSLAQLVALDALYVGSGRIVPALG